MIRSNYKNLLTRNSNKCVLQARHIVNSIVLRSQKVPEEALPVNLLEKFQTSHFQRKGEIYDKRPFKVRLEANKKYAWCCCGISKSQPFCDGSHRIEAFKTDIKPIFLKVAETKDYWLCNCKQSLHRPFCDGTHLNEDIQKKSKHFKN